MGSKKTAIIYCRTSTKGQRDADTIEAQVSFCRALVEREGFQLVPYGPKHDGWVKDNGISGTLLEGRSFEALIDDLQNGRVRFDYLVCYSMSRLARQDKTSKDMHKLVRSAEDKARISAVLIGSGVKVYDKDGPQDPASVLTEIKSVLSGQERTDFVERTTRGKARVIGNGAWATGGRVPYGYERVFANGKNRNENTTLAPHPIDGPRVKKLLAKWFVEGGKTYAARKAEEAGWPTPRANATWDKKPRERTYWYASTIQQLLNNIGAYLGEKTLSIYGETKTVTYPPLFTLKEYAAIMRRQKETSLPHRTTLLGSGFVRCGVCQRNVHGSRSSTAEHFHITCRKRCTRMREDEFSRALWELVVCRLLQLAEQQRTIGNKAANAAQISEAKEKLKAVQGKIDRVVALYAEGEIDKAALTKTNETLKAEKTAIQVEIDRLVRERDAKATKVISEESVHANVQSVLRRLKAGRLNLDERRRALSDLLQGERVVLVRKGGKKGTPVISMPAFGQLPSVTVRLDQDITQQIKGVSRQAIDAIYRVEDVVEDVAMG